MSQSSATLRLMSDLRSLRVEPPEGVSASPASEDNLFVWTATVFGPDDTPWEGGIFSLRLTFPETYPEKPPRIRFVSEVFHPNVFQDGNICLDVIGENWSPTQTVSSLLTSIQSLLTDPNCSSPANPEAANLYMTDRGAYAKRVRRVVAKSLEGG